MTRAALAFVIVPALDLSRLTAGRLRFVWFVVLKVSQRNCAFARSASWNHLESERLMFALPGPSRMLRPELPYRNALSGTTANAAGLYQRFAVGLSRAPLARRSGRVACARSAEGPESCGVNGCPLYMVPVPANCQPRTSMFRRNGNCQAKFMLNTWRMSKSDRPRSDFRLSESCAP